MVQLTKIHFTITTHNLLFYYFVVFSYEYVNSLHVKELSVIKLSYIKSFAFRDCRLDTVTIINKLAYSKIIVTIKKIQQNQFSK